MREIYREERREIQEEDKDSKAFQNKALTNGICDILVECGEENGIEMLNKPPSRARVVSFSLPITRTDTNLEDKQGRAASGGLLLLIIFAVVITGSFLMSPYIETMFSKYQGKVPELPLPFVIQQIF